MSIMVRRVPTRLEGLVLHLQPGTRHGETPGVWAICVLLVATIAAQETPEAAASAAAGVKMVGPGDYPSAGERSETDHT
jgi:cobalamin biosynthesis protein CobD/CbiB